MATEVVKIKRKQKTHSTRNITYNTGNIMYEIPANMNINERKYLQFCN